ncbi:MAG: YwaF family protein [Lachnospiraceae bacterium]|nr:YwaF family protein [Lachnospiraceae bacterium]
MSNFWKEKTYRPENEGYGLFSTEYFLVLAIAMIIVVAAILFFGKKRQNEKERLCRIFAWVPLGMEIVKFIVLFSQGCYTSNYYPIGFCSLVAYLYPIYAYTKNDNLKKAVRCIICMVMLPSGLVTLFFPNWIGHYRLLSYFSLHSYIWHMIMVIYPIWTWQKDRKKLYVRDMVRGDSVIILLIPVIVLINKYCGTNYWFLSEPTDNHPLASVYRTAGPGGYFAVFVIIGVTIACLFGLLQNVLFMKFLSKNPSDQ